jgi:hypothetical protein
MHILAGIVRAAIGIAGVVLIIVSSFCALFVVRVVPMKGSIAEAYAFYAMLGFFGALLVYFAARVGGR